MNGATVQGFADAYAAALMPSKAFGRTNRMWVGSGMKTALHWANPFPPGAQIISAKLYFTSVNAWAGATTLAASLLTSGWAASTLNWVNFPGITGYTSYASNTNTPARFQWEMDITPQMQAVAHGAPWWGLALHSEFPVKGGIYSNFAPQVYAPVMQVLWSEAPQPPVNLLPTGGKVIGTPSPLFSWNFVDYSGNITQAAFKVELTRNPFIGWEYSSNWVESPVSMFQYPGEVGVGVNHFWRVTTMDQTGYESPPSSTLAIFKYMPHGTLTLNNPSTVSPVVDEPTPAILWDFSVDQQAYQVLVYDFYTRALLWDSWRITSSEGSYSIPVGVIREPGKKYSMEVRVWDFEDRITIANSTSYVSAFVDFTYTPSTSVAPMEDLQMEMDPDGLSATFTARRATLPDAFVFMRNGEVIQADMQPLEYRDPVDHTLYRFTDYPPGRRDTTWEIVPVVNGVAAADNPTVTRSIRRTLSWLTAHTRDLPVAFLNPTHSTKHSDNSSVLQVNSGTSVLVTESLGGLTGSFSGVLSDEAPVAHSARDMLRNLEDIREKHNGHGWLYFSDEALEVYIFGLEVQRQDYPDGSTDYTVKFEFFEVV